MNGLVWILDDSVPICLVRLIHKCNCITKGFQVISGSKTLTSIMRGKYYMAFWPTTGDIISLLGERNGKAKVYQLIFTIDIYDIPRMNIVMNVPIFMKDL